MQLQNPMATREPSLLTGHPSHLLKPADLSPPSTSATNTSEIMTKKPTWTTPFALAMALALLVSAAWAADMWKLCNMTQDGLAACRPAISEPAQKGAPPPGPTDACCAALGHADLACLCGYKNSGLLSYFGVDPDLAMELPAKCSLPAPAKC